jgi:type VI secretion system protein ImpG
VADDQLLQYYERELTFLRRMGVRFAREYPKIAKRLDLDLEPIECDDPHVERMLEGFAFLAARVHKRIDEDVPEISEALLEIVYPHYVRPIPSVTLVEIELDRDQGKLTSGLPVPRNSLLYSKKKVDGEACKFTTCYDTTLWPVRVGALEWMPPDRLKPAMRVTDAVAALRLELHCFTDLEFKALELSSLRLHLAGDAAVKYTLYELLCNNCTGIVVREPGTGKKTLTLPPSVLQPGGFGEHDGILPYPRRSFLGYRLLQEYFTFPEKFLFFDLAVFDAVRAAGFGEKAEIIFLIRQFERSERRGALDTGLSPQSMRLGCTPVVNLFEKSADPILLTQRRSEYMIVPDARRRHTTQVFSVNEVTGITPGSTEPLRIEPLYSYRHAHTGKRPALFWTARRRPTEWRLDRGTDVHLSFVDLSGRTAHPDRDAITARLTCFNADLPSQLPIGDERGDFELENGGPIQRIIALATPTEVVHPPLGQAQLWRLLSQLSLNYLPLADGGADALREILRLHNFSDTAAGERHIDGVMTVAGEPTYARVVTEHGVAFARGRRVDVMFDEEQYAGGGLYLFASVLERFFGMYASVNSFTTLVARSTKRKDVVRAWPPRAGWKSLV